MGWVGRSPAVSVPFAISGSLHRRIEAGSGAQVELNPKSLESSQLGRLYESSRAGFFLFYFVVVPVLPRARIVLGMDSDDDSVGFIRDLGDGVFSLAGAQCCIECDDSAFSRLRR